LAVGDTFVMAEPAVSRTEIMDFARAYDPQAWHLDDAAAAKSVFGALCASGWHSSALVHRICLRRLWPQWAPTRLALVHEMRWAKPLFPDVPLQLTVTILAIDTDPACAFGRVTVNATLADDQALERVIMRADWLVARRTPGPEPAAPPPEDQTVPPAAETEQSSGPADQTVWFEDVPIGNTRRYGRYLITAEEIANFAANFDRRDDTDQSAPIWLYAAAWMRMTVEHSIGTRNAAAMGSPGFRTMEWLQPVYPGDILSARVTTTEKVTPKSRQDIGFILSRTEVLNQHDQVVMRFGGQGMVRRRPIL